MKRILLSTIALLISTFTYAQETVKRSNNLSTAEIETFSVLKSDKKIKQDEYTATYNNVLVAKGNYQDGKRASAWDFFNATGMHVQTYNYDTRQITFADTSGSKRLKYRYATDIKSTDTVSKPVKIGGYYYSLVLITYRPEIVTAIHKDFPDVENAVCTNILTVNAQGEIIKHEAIISANGAEKHYNLNMDDFDADLKQYIPAMINHQPVACEVISTDSMKFHSTIIRSRTVTGTMQTTRGY